MVSSSSSSLCLRFSSRLKAYYSYTFKVLFAFTAMFYSNEALDFELIWRDVSVFFSSVKIKNHRKLFVTTNYVQVGWFTPGSYRNTNRDWEQMDCMKVSFHIIPENGTGAGIYCQLLFRSRSRSLCWSWLRSVWINQKDREIIIIGYVGVDRQECC